MKRTVAFLIAIVTVFVCGVRTMAITTPEHGVYFCRYTNVYYPRVKQGDILYYMSKPFENIPEVYEAELCLEDGDDRAGVLISNKDDSGGAHISIETDSRGIPLYRYTDRHNVTRTVLFDNCLLIAGKRTTLTVIHRAERILCYIDGVLMQSADGYPSAHPECIRNVFTVGGDSEYQNYPPFHGTLYSLTVAKNGKLLARYNFSDEDDIITDESESGNHLMLSRTWTNGKKLSSERAYTLAVIGDTQYMSEFYPDSLISTYKWISRAADTYNIKCVLGLGDMTNRDTDYEWDNVAKALTHVSNIPCLMVRGNHDIRTNTALSNNAYHLSQSGVANVLGDSTGGHGFDRVLGAIGGYTDGLFTYSDSSLTNGYRVINCGDTEWLILALDYLPTTDVIDWASAVLDAHSDYPAIITTHAYLNRNGQVLDYAEYIRDSLISKHPNVKLVLSGHINSARIIKSQYKQTTQLLIDSQTCDNRFRGAGFVALLHFDKSGQRCEVEYVSTASESKGLHYRTINQFSFSIK